MLLNKFVRSDGTVIDSASIISCKWTSGVNSSTNLTVGDTTADSVDVQIRNPEKGIVTGEALEYYKVDGNTETKVGVFYAEAPTVASKVSIRFTAYDSIAKLGVDASPWLMENQDNFPMSLRAIVDAVCDLAGITGKPGTFSHEDLQVPAFYSDGITARQIVSWAAQIAGCFCRSTSSGGIEFAWYEATETVISDSKATGTIQYMQDSLSCKQYQTDVIQRVQLKQADDDVGVIYPADADGNVFAISGNLMLSMLDTPTLEAIAQDLFAKVKDISYTPAECKLFPTCAVNAGDIIKINTVQTGELTVYVMSVYTDSSGTQVSSTGDQNYSDKAAVSSEKYQNPQGRYYLLKKSIDGLKATAKDLEGNISEIEQTAERIATSVSDQGNAITQLQQTSKEISATVTSIVENGVDKVTTSFGLTIDESYVHIQRSGSEMENRLDETGMYVMRGNEIMLQANKDGVIGTDMTVRNYLIIGSHARFEDYTDDDGAAGTACFYI
nr:MAG TPA_asm: hypothetical protein [Caudoviricetes sp.]